MTDKMVRDMQAELLGAVINHYKDEDRIAAIKAWWGKWVRELGGVQSYSRKILEKMKPGDQEGFKDLGRIDVCNRIAQNAFASGIAIIDEDCEPDEGMNPPPPDVTQDRVRLVFLGLPG